MNRVLGIDPGTLNAGFGIIDYNSKETRYIASGTILMDPKADIDHRLYELGEDLREIFEKFSPTAVALERAFFGKNAQSALKIGHARGVVMYIARQFGVSISEHTPTRVKSSICGQGNAPKEQVSDMVRLLLELPTGFEFNSHDQSDALAICLTHAQTVTSYDRTLNG